MVGCLACETIRARSAPGGCIHETEHWFVDHCVGPFGEGTLIVKPKRHVVQLGALDTAEAGELGRLLQQASSVAARLTDAEQVYATLWSHMHAVPGHIHFVVQPVTRALMDAHDGRHGARLQVDMLDRKVFPDPAVAAALAARARELWPS